MNSDLIERYVYAVARRLKTKERGDIEAELKELINDMLEERCQGRQPGEKDVLIVLTELGKPSELAAKYGSDKFSCLIGPNYYSQYKLIIKLLLITLAGAFALANIILIVLEPIAWYIAAARWLGMTIMGLLSAFGFVTALFAIFERKGVKVRLDESIENLPPVPKKLELVSKGDSIAMIVFCALFAVVFLVVPQIIGIRFLQNGDWAFGAMPQTNGWVALFKPDALYLNWYLVIGFAALGIARECVKLYEGKYTKRVAAVSVCVDALSVAIACALFLNPAIINPDFFVGLDVQIAGTPEFVIRLIANFNIVLLCLIIVALIIDGVKTIYRWRAGAKKSN